MTLALRHPIDRGEPVSAALIEPLRTVLRDLAGPRQRIEGAFLDVGRCLIEASGLLGGITATFDALAARLEGAEAESMAGVSETLARRVLAITRSAGRNTHDLSALIGEIAAIRRPIAELSSAVKMISLVAVGTRMNAAQLSGNGSDFTAFTSDIMRLSERATATIDNFSAVYERLGATLEAADAKRVMLRTTQTRALSGLTERLEASLLAAAEHRTQAVSASGEIGQLFARISAGIASVITALQIGDITRQRIEHVEEGLASLIEPAAGPAARASGEDIALIAAVCRLQSAQAEQATQEFEREAVHVVEIVGQLASDASDIVAQSRRIHEETVEASRTALAGLAEEVRKACALMRECETARAELDQAAAAVNTSLQDLLRCVRAVQAIKGEMHLVGINMGLKCARLGAEGRTLNVIAQELRELAEKTVTHAHKAVEGLNQAATHAQSLTATATVLDEIEELEEEARHSASVHEGDHGLAEALELLAREGTHAAELLNKAAERTRSQGEIGRALRTAIGAIDRIRADAHALHAASGTGDVDLAEQAAFAQLKARYTMASERTLHDRFAGRASQAEPSQSAVSSDSEFDLDDIFL